MQNKLSILNSSILAIAAIFFVYIIYSNAYFYSDDSFISFRYLANFINGNGLVFNSGEHVEGYTNFLFIILLSPFYLIGLEPLFASRILNIIAVLGLIFIGYRYLKTSLSQHQQFFSSVFVFVIASSYPVVSWAMGGMESTLLAMFVFAAVVFVLIGFEGRTRTDGSDQEIGTGRLEAFSARFRSPGRNRMFVPYLISSILFSLAYLTRPDSILFATIAGMFLLIKTRQIKPLLYFALPLAITISLHLLWRFNYYGDIMPNTYYAKIYGISGEALFWRGFYHVKAFLSTPPYLGVLLIACIPFIFANKKQLTGNLMLAVMILTYACYIMYVGGDWMPVFRFFVPLIPLLTLFCIRIFANNFGEISLKKYLLSFISIFLISFSQYAHPAIQYRPNLEYLENSWQAMADHINEDWPKDSLIAINMAGYIPYKTMNHRYLDMLGINDNVISKRTGFSADYIANKSLGHMKGDGAYVLSRKPDYIIMASGFDNNLIKEGIYLSEKEMLKDPSFHKNYKLIKQELVVKMPEHVKDFHNKESRNITFCYYKRAFSQKWQ